MSAFRRGDLQVLVATTVIEVGVDIPDATVMVIEDADRFGIAQLHQLRGRVGRSDLKSWCYLLSRNSSPEATRRLEALERSTDGFELAEVDLDLRGEGTILGSRQKGRSDLKLATLRPADRRLVQDARQVAESLLGRGSCARAATPSSPTSSGSFSVRTRRSSKRADGDRRCGSSARRRWNEPGRRLAAPVAEGVRPTSDRVRESIFDILGSLVDLDGLRVADLFAGTGRSRHRGAVAGRRIGHVRGAGRAPLSRRSGPTSPRPASRVRRRSSPR